MGKRLAAIGMAAAIAGGGLTVAALNPLTVAGANTSTTTGTNPAADTAKVHRKGPLQRALDKLVADGTLTRAQADKVLSTTKAEAKAEAPAAEAEAPSGPTSTPLKGAAARVVKNMESSLSIPTATSVRAVPAKLLDSGYVFADTRLDATLRAAFTGR